MIKSILVGLMGAGTIGTFAICDLCQPVAEATRLTVASTEAPLGILHAAEPQEVTLKVEGMTCGGCAIAARTVLERLDGVDNAEVSYEKSLAVVTYDPEKGKIEQMVAALEELGYTAAVVPEGVTE